MASALTEYNKPLSFIELKFTHERILVPLSLENIDEKMQLDIFIVNGQRIDTKGILRYGPATSVEYYRHYIFPSLKNRKLKSRLQDLFDRLDMAPEGTKERVTLDQILAKQKEIENDLIYYS